MRESDHAENMFNAINDVYYVLTHKSTYLDKYVMGLINIVTHSSRCLGSILIGRKNHRLKKEEANKIEAIVRLSRKLDELAYALTKSRRLKSKLESEKAEVLKGGSPEDEGKIIGDNGEVIGDVREILGEEEETILGKKDPKSDEANIVGYEFYGLKTT